LVKQKAMKNDDYINEVNFTDHSDKMFVLQLAILALKNQTKEFFELLPLTLDKGN